MSFRLQLRQPFLPDLFSFLGAKFVRHREAVPPGEGLASVDEHSAHGEVALVAFFRWQTWIEIGTPGLEYLDRLRGIDARAHGPDHLFQIRSEERRVGK